MPKEIVHMGIARMVSHKICAESMFFSPVRRYPDLFLYGSVAPDTGFFYLKGPGLELIQDAGKKFHVDNASAMTPVINLLNQAGLDDDAALAFSAGVCCHLMTDTVFHPMIYYYCGLDGVHEGATARHRLFETVLDEYASAVFNGFSAQKVQSVFFKMALGLLRVKPLLGLLFNNAYRNAGKWMLPAFFMHHFWTFLFQFRQVPDFLNALGLEIPSEFSVLFYSKQHRANPSFFGTRIRYQDPETGQPFDHTIKEMIHHTLENTLIVLDRIEKHLRDEKKRQRAFDESLDPMMVRPCPPLDAKGFRYWNEKSDIRSMICH